MNFTIAEVAPGDIREPAIDFFWRLRAWPFAERDEYARAWDWRYSHLSEDTPRVWVARRSDGLLVGHIAAYPRHFRLGEQIIRAIVPGNFVVDPEHRNTLIGPRLAMQPRSVVRRGEAALVLAFGNEAAHQMFMRQGFTDLGRFTEYLDVRHWAPVFRRRFRPAVILGPILDAVSALRRTIRYGRVPADLRAQEIPAGHVKALDLSHWAASPLIEGAGSTVYLSGRFLASPHHPRRMIGVTNGEGRLEAYAILSASNSTKVWECRVNHDRLDIVNALRLVARDVPDLDSIAISILAQSALASDLRRSGLLQREPSAYEASRRWSVYVSPDHELAHELTNPARWLLQYGSTHY